MLLNEIYNIIIIWTCHQYFVLDNIILPRSLGRDPDTPTYIEVVSSINIAPVRRSKGQQEDYTEGLSLVCIKWNIDDISS